MLRVKKRILILYISITYALPVICGWNLGNRIRANGPGFGVGSGMARICAKT
jgi:hypothetical protein